MSGLCQKKVIGLNDFRIIYYSTKSSNSMIVFDMYNFYNKMINNGIEKFNYVSDFHEIQGFVESLLDDNYGGWGF